MGKNQHSGMRNILLLPFVLMFSLQACNGDDGIPAFVGLWEYLEAKPVEHVDSCYFDTWFEIAVDNRFQLYDPCRSEMITGAWYLHGVDFGVTTDDGSYNDFAGRMLAVNDKYMLVEVDIENELTQVMFKKTGPGVP